MTGSEHQREKAKVVAWYGRGPHFRKVLAYLRQKYPSFPSCAVVPSSYPQALIAPQVDEIRTIRGALDALYHAWHLRRQGVRCVAVMFDSFRLRTIAALCGAEEQGCVTLDGRWVVFSESLARYALRRARKRILGTLQWLRILVHVYAFPVRNDAIENKLPRAMRSGREESPHQ